MYSNFIQRKRIYFIVILHVGVKPSVHLLSGRKTQMQKELTLT